MKPWSRRSFARVNEKPASGVLPRAPQDHYDMVCRRGCTRHPPACRLPGLCLRGPRCEYNRCPLPQITHSAQGNATAPMPAQHRHEAREVRCGGSNSLSAAAPDATHAIVGAVNNAASAVTAAATARAAQTPTGLPVALARYEWRAGPFRWTAGWTAEMPQGTMLSCWSPLDGALASMQSYRASTDRALTSYVLVP